MRIFQPNIQFSLFQISESNSTAISAWKREEKNSWGWRSIPNSSVSATDQWWAPLLIVKQLIFPGNMGKVEEKISCLSPE